ncbi:MAG TPA: putative baseplate assembly protein [Gemmatimonadales bacterium]|jgi:hypothetical protein
MSTLVYSCCDDRRKARVKALGTLNGIDFLEVSDDQLHLFVHFVNPPAFALRHDNVQIEGGERIVAHIADGDPVRTGDVFDITVQEPGDFSPYVLRLLDIPGNPLSLDPRLSQVEFSFKVGCPSPFDCRPEILCPPVAVPAPHIDYLARDYQTFRRVMLDRLSLLLPGWRERHAADLAVMLVELLAFVGDRLTYEQDGIATEAYLGTARLRTSVRRHARLVDYPMHDGCNARAFVRIDVTAPLTVARGTQLFTRLEGVRPRVPFALIPDPILAQGPEVFETMHNVACFPHDALHFYTWDAVDCCLPIGATSATLRGHQPDLHVGDFLVFEEIADPKNPGSPDADASHRHVVRLTSVALSKDTLENIDVTEIAWAEDDALDFPLCVSVSNAKGGSIEISVALANVVLVDHGQTLPREELGAVPQPPPPFLQRPAPRTTHCDRSGPVDIPPRYRPTLQKGPLTQAAPLVANVSAATSLRWELGDVLPAILQLTGTLHGDVVPWTVADDLFETEETSTEFVVEVEENGLASLRFGDDEYGKRPEPGTAFAAVYRIGNGTRGNVGAGAIAHIATTDGGVVSVTNPLPAGGGVDPETLEHVRHAAPAAFRTQQRAVTEEDYATVSGRIPTVQRAAATFRWTGSWYTVFDTVDRRGGAAVDRQFRKDALDFLERFRVVGKDIEVDQPRFVSLEIGLVVCVEPDYFRADVEAALLERFSSGVQHSGELGFFNPDRFTFGQPLYLSAIYEAAQDIEGVEAVVVKPFQRQGFPTTDGTLAGRLDFDRLEIARLDNNPDFPEHGKLDLTMRGGK